jgi:pilus assembly protein Flp/PilA
MVCTMGRHRTLTKRSTVPSPTQIRLGICRALGRFTRDSSAATSVEYAVMLALILGVILVSITLLGSNTKQLWTTNNTSLQGVGFGS